MSIEPKRGCGYRKVGGIYLVGQLLPGKCHRLPIPLETCPTCKQGIKQTRGWAWVEPDGILGDKCIHDHPDHRECPVCAPVYFEGQDAGLLWVGEGFYATPEDWYKEAVELGASKRINAVPRGYIVGVTRVFLAHPKATYCGPPDYNESLPGIFHLWQPERIEKIITQTQSEDHEFMNRLYLHNLTPVIVPDNDPDHNPKEV